MRRSLPFFLTVVACAAWLSWAMAVNVQAISVDKRILNVPIISQKPELYNGCEVTSLAMLLHYAGFKVSKMDLANQVKKDADPIKENRSGDIVHWGNPDHGFVGDITGEAKGYAVHDKPMEHLMRHYLRNRTLNLTGSAFSVLLNQIVNRKPVLVWTTVHFGPPRTWELWNHGTEQIKATMEIHTVLLVGYDPHYVYVNDPLSGIQAQKINRQIFLQSWIALGRKALSYL